MAATRYSGYEPQSLRGVLGCAFIVPAALFGTAILIEDHLYSGRWYLLTELLGWWTICIGVSVGCAALIARSHTTGRSGYRFLLASVACAVAFTLFIVGEAHPGAPAWLKDAFIASLQIIGILTLPAMAAYLGWVGRKSRRS